MEVRELLFGPDIREIHLTSSRWGSPRYLELPGVYQGETGLHDLLAGSNEDEVLATCENGGFRYFRIGHLGGGETVPDQCIELQMTRLENTTEFFRSNVYVGGSYCFMGVLGASGGTESPGLSARSSFPQRPSMYSRHASMAEGSIRTESVLM